MKGINHEIVNLFLFIISTNYLSYLHVNYKSIIIFSVVFYIFTYFITPDVDMKSRPSKRLWVLGWIPRLLLKHRGISHSFIGWTVIFIVGYYFIGFLVFGACIPVYSHLVLDSVF
ncbi:MAG TPA: DUF2227 family putative metal-binding protein [Clostridia bacterium]|nr:DUF2227 family putative metal-binding protein [Clostridia bacterium]